MFWKIKKKVYFMINFTYEIGFCLNLHENIVFLAKIALSKSENFTYYRYNFSLCEKSQTRINTRWKYMQNSVSTPSLKLFEVTGFELWATAGTAHIFRFSGFPRKNVKKRVGNSDSQGNFRSKPIFEWFF